VTHYGDQLAPPSVSGSSALRTPHSSVQAETREADADGNVALLGRIAGLHADLAAAYGELAENQLAAPPDPGLMSPMPERPKLLAARDVAELLRVDTKTVRRWRSEGKLPPAIELGGSVVRWRAEDIDRWLEEQR